MEKLVSAIITTHNRKKLLRRAIDSVFAQTYSNIELIVVDDHSEDGTSQICQDPRINYIYIPPEESKGGNYARNLGIKNAKGVFVAFLDDDDEWMPTKVEKQVALLKEKHCSMVYCLRQYLYILNGAVSKTTNELPNKPFGNLKDKIFEHYITSTSCLLVEKEALKAIGGFDEKLRKWQEYDLMIRMAEISEIHYVEEPLCKYRFDVSDTQRISNDFDGVLETLKYFRIKYANRLSQLPLRIKLYFDEMCVFNIYALAKRTDHWGYRFIYLIPYIVLKIFKTIDNRLKKYNNMERFEAKSVEKSSLGGGIVVVYSVRLHVLNYNLKAA